jgi:hypothetical protein
MIQEDQRGATIGLLLDHYWTTTGPLLEHYWNTTGQLLDHYWTISGTLLDNYAHMDLSALSLQRKPALGDDTFAVLETMMAVLWDLPWT